MESKVVVITGGTTGIGFACAEYLANLNYKVVITGRGKENLETAVSSLGNSAVGILSDTSSLGDIDTLVQRVTDEFGKIDGLFVNAGIFKASNFEDATEALFDEIISVNLKGAFFTIQKFIPILKNPSSIVLNTSIVVFKAFPGTSIYTASKAALESIAKVLNVELAPKGIRINTVSPGVTQTPAHKKSGMSDESIEDLFEHFASISPIGRVVQPEDIAPIVDFLLSERSLVLRGEKIVVDGGATL